MQSPLGACPETKFVATEAGKPSIAVLSLGCGTTSELKSVDKYAGPIGWAVKVGSPSHVYNKTRLTLSDNQMRHISFV